MNFDEVIKRLSAAQGNPEALTLATLDLVLASADAEVREAFAAAAIPHWFDEPILSKMLGRDDQPLKILLDKLSRLPMVEAFDVRNGWNVHEATRLAFRNHLSREQPDRLKALSARALSCFPGEEPHLIIERLFHRLVAEPAQAADELYRTWTQWTRAGRHQRLQAMAVMLREIRKLPALEPAALGFADLCFACIMQDYFSQPEIEALARQALDLFLGLKNSFGEAQARCLLGETLYARGALEEAGKEFDRYKEIVQRLLQGDPDNVELLRELSTAHTNVGIVCRDRKEFDPALNHFRESQRILLDLTERDPKNLAWLRDLGVAHYYLGSWSLKQQRQPEALAEFQALKKIMIGLTERDPENMSWLRELSVAQNCVGVILQGQGQLDEARKEYQSYRETIESLARRDPENTSLQRELSVAYNCVGSVLETQGDFRAAIQQHEHALQIAQKLVALDPTNVKWQEDLLDFQKSLARAQASSAGTTTP